MSYTDPGPDHPRSGAGRSSEPGAALSLMAAIITGLAGIVVSLIYVAVTVVILVVAIGAANS